MLENHCFGRDSLFFPGCVQETGKEEKLCLLFSPRDPFAYEPSANLLVLNVFRFVFFWGGGEIT